MFQGKIVPARGPTNFGEATLDMASSDLVLTSVGWDPIFEYEGQTYLDLPFPSFKHIS